MSQASILVTYKLPSSATAPLETVGTVDVYRDGVHSQQVFARGEALMPMRVIGGTTRKGTSLRFRPDPAICGTPPQG